MIKIPSTVIVFVGLGLTMAACDMGDHSPDGGTGGYSTFTPPGTNDSDGTSGMGFGGFAATDMTPVVLAATPPPALTGGTMLIAKDGVTAVAADPDRDTVWWTNVATADAPSVHSIKLAPGDEPGRVVEDGAGLVHIALRRGGAVVTIDLAAGKVVRRTSVCPAPRGIAYDPVADTIIVACVGGELVTLAAADDTNVRTLPIESDLRDVVVLGNGFLAVSKLRTAQVLLLDGTGAIRSRTQALGDADPKANADVSVAWRMVPIPGILGGVAVAHQRATNAPIELEAPNGYSGDSGDSMQDIVTSAVTFFHFNLTSPDAAPALTSIGVESALPVDLAFDAQGENLVVALYGEGSVGQYLVNSSPPLQEAPVITSGAATSVGFDGSNRPIAFFREPPSFVINPGAPTSQVIAISAPSVRDTGHDLFHLAAREGGSLACASCHPEGRDDGRVWQFVPIGARRTPSLVGGILVTAPFHWDGDLPDMDSLMTEVFTRRMGGDSEDTDHVAALARFVDAIPRIPLAPPRGSPSLFHGKTLFESDALLCTSCHSGARLTNNATVDVGTGKAFQVPSLLGVGLLAPYLHNGCATTLADRFGPCGGGNNHGNTSQLTPGDVADLSLYLSSL